MRTRMAWLAGCLALALVSFVALTRGQDRVAPIPASEDASRPATSEGPAPSALTAEAPARDLSKLSPLQQQMYLSAQRGAEWLYRANGQQGRFVYGFLPALKAPMEGDHYLRQVGAAFALARAARFTGETRYAVRATQAILVLLGETTTDAKDPQVRYTALPSLAVNRLAAAGLLVLAIHELPSAEKDLLDQAEQLCQYIRQQQRADGSLSYADGADEKTTTEDPDGINYYPGEALYGLIRSQAQRPAAWKLDAVGRAVSYYLPWWRTHKSMAFVPWHSAAYAEAYLLTKEAAFAQAVNEMNDWICTLQYQQFDQRHPLWLGGFMSWADGKANATPPTVGSAPFAEGLAEACRVAQATGDLEHYRRYGDALERCLQFLTTLQYTDANTTHFQAWYRPKLLGAFYASDQDGNLRIDYTQHAVCAMVQYLSYVARPQ